ncbi:glycosyltransferase family 39 protein [Lewinella sp. 4G2]|uniref:glycosyltransferase family 39 protein n=1 Tax=Lewinella sp. 4G2 TaxID=1803372 RepID=UPI0007B4C841|nr:glycosyltransferase family 39 protein [Lewinella sp. 4G2]OAV44456.1 hypothetical protein A3850_008120 [Lewinella sp. 4G2]
MSDATPQRRSGKVSRYALLALILTVLATHFFYAPRWKQTGLHTTISWDVSGYYAYLPAVFIHDQLDNPVFLQDVVDEYMPTPHVNQAFLHEESGNLVMKYSAGQALIYTPFFLAAHAYATASPQYPPDGYSFPYQLAVSIGFLIYAIIGLIFLRKILRRYFDEWPVALTMAGIVLGSNYLNYTALDGAMTHNTLFVLYTLLIYTTIRFYERPDLAKGAIIGVLVGLAALTRPTEILSCLIPLLWGVDLTSRESIQQRLKVLGGQLPALGTAALITLAIGSLQLFYWHHATGNWIVYSYEEEGFSWLAPHLREGFVSYESGWLLYSPLMVFSLIGFYFLFRRDRRLFFPTIIFSILFIYVAFAWDHWTYGGSLGQRTMVQCYPILAFPLTAFVAACLKGRTVMKWIVGALTLLFIYANLWFTHQAHRGGLLHVGVMTEAYFWNTLFTYDKNPVKLRMLDGQKRIFPGEPSREVEVYRDTSYRKELNPDNTWAGVTKIPSDLLPEDYEWIRVYVTGQMGLKEWNHYNMTQFRVETYFEGAQITRDFYKIQRIMEHGETKRLFLDVRKPLIPIDTITVDFWNVGSPLPFTVTDLSVAALYE